MIESHWIDPDGGIHPVTNLGWLYRHAAEVEYFEMHPHPCDKGMQPDMVLVAAMTGGRYYKTGYMCESIWKDQQRRSQWWRTLPCIDKREKKP